MKKTWEKPKLVILTRNNPQEAVLSVCKGFPDVGMVASTAPSSFHDSCMLMPAANNFINCLGCQEVNLS